MTAADDVYEHGIYTADDSDTASIEVGDGTQLTHRINDLSHVDGGEVESVTSYDVSGVDESFSHVRITSENIDRKSTLQTTTISPSK